MSEERAVIIVEDKVSTEPAKKIKYLGDVARTSHEEIKKLRDQLNQINTSSVRKLQQELANATSTTTRQATTLEKLAQAQNRTAQSAAKAEKAQNDANLSAARGATEQQRLTTEMYRSERAQLQATTATEKLTQARIRGASATEREMDAVTRYYREIERARAKQNAASSQSGFNALAGISDAGVKSARASMQVFTDDAKAKAAAAKESANLERRANALKGAIDPLYTAQLQFNRATAEANTLLARGAITQSEHARATAMATQALNSHTSAQHASANATKLNRFQLLTLQYTINDIVASLASGASPFTILAQQGGQVTQAWGGVGATFRALAAAIASPVGIIVSLVAAFGTVFAVVDAGKAEFAGLQRQLDLTNGSAGVTAGGFTVMAEKIAEATNRSVAASKEVAMGFAKTGQFQKTQIDELSTATLNFSKLSGETSDKIVKDWAKMADGPSKFAAEFSKQYGVFTAQQYEYIRVLEDTGRKQEAIAATSRVLYDYYGKEAPQNLGYLARAWNAVSNAISDYWTKLKNIGTDTPIQKQFEEAQKAAQKLEQHNKNMGDKSPMAAKQLADAKLLVANLQRSVELEERQARNRMEAVEAQKRGVAAIASLDDYTASIADNSQKAEQAIEKFRKQLADAGAQNPNSATYLNALKNQAQIEAGLRKKYMPDATREGKKDANEAEKSIERQNKLISELGGTTKTYERDLDDLNDARKRLNMSDQVYLDLLAKLQAKNPEEQKKVKAMQAAYQEQMEFQQELGEARKREDDLNEQARASMRQYESAITDASAALANELKVMDLSIEKRERALLYLNAELELQKKLKEIDRSDRPANVKEELSNRARSAQAGVISNIDAQLTVGLLKDIEQYLDPTKAQSFGDALKDAFGSAGDALSKLTDSLQDYYAKSVELQRKQSRLADDKNMDPAKKMQEQNKLIRQQEKLQINAYGDMASAAKGFFKEGSKGYKALEAAEKTFRAFELAQAALNFATKMGWITAETAAVVTGESVKSAAVVAGTTTQVAADQVKGMSAAAVGVATQAQGDPYTAWVRMALMAAAMAALGFAVGGGGGSGGPPEEMTAAYRQKHQGTGTVLGDDTAKSESIKNSLELMENNSDIALKYSSEMVITLRSIRDGISGMSAFISRSSGLRGTVADQRALGVGSSKGAFGFSSKSTTLTDTGIYIDRIQSAADQARYQEQLAAWARGDLDTEFFGESGSMMQRGQKPVQDLLSGSRQTVGSVMAGGLSARSYSDLHKERSSFWGLSKSSSDETIFGDLDKSLKEQLTLTIGSMYDGVVMAADKLGVSGKDLEDKLRGVELGFDRISLMGLNGAEIGAELEAVFGSLGDDMAIAAVPAIGAFQKVGEGAFETLMRVSNGLDVGTYALERLNIQAIKWTDISNKQGDVGAELVRESILVTEQAQHVGKGIGDIIASLDGTVDDIASVYTELNTLRDKFNANGLNGEDISRNTIRGAGGLDSLTRGADVFFSSFFSEAEQQASRTALLNKEFAALNLATPKTRDEFRALVMAADDGTEAGARLVGRLLSLAGATDEAISGVDDLSDSLRDLANDAFDILSRVVDRERDRIKRAFDAQMESLNAQQKASEERLSKMQKIADLLKNTVNALTLNETLGMSRNEAVSQVDAALALARSGVLPDADAIANALSVITRPSADLFNSFVDYSRDFDEQAAKIVELNRIAQGQVSIEQQTLDAIKAQKEAAQLQFDQQMAYFDAILDNAQAQLDKLEGIDISVMSLDDALRYFADALANAIGVALAPPPAAPTGPDANGNNGMNQWGTGWAGTDQSGGWWGPAGYVPGGAGSPSHGNNGAVFGAMPSFAVGANTIPQDMIAQLHKGEQVVPAAFNPTANYDMLVASRIDDLISEQQNFHNEALLLWKDIRRVIMDWDENGMPGIREEDQEEA